MRQSGLVEVISHVLKIILLSNTVQLKIQEYVFIETPNLKQVCRSGLCSQMGLYMGPGEPQGVWCSWSGCGPTDSNPSVQDTPIHFPTASRVYTGSREAMPCVISSRTLPQTHIRSHLLPSLRTEEEGNVCALPLCGEKSSSCTPLMEDWEIHMSGIGLTRSYSANEREKLWEMWQKILMKWDEHIEAIFAEGNPSVPGRTNRIYTMDLY